MKKLSPLLAFFAAAFAALNAYAEAGYESIPTPWQLNFLPPATPVMEKLDNLHTFLLYLITAISIFVLVVMIYICVRFRRKANPVPSKTTHNTKLEIIWTTIPIIILVVIAIPSLRLHYFMQRPEATEMTLKVVGYQWYWHYEYPDHGGFGFDSYIKKGEDLKPGDHRLLSVDNRVVVPVDTAVKVLLTGADVIHAWAVPSFGVKKDAIPGRLNETWFKATKLGTYYGQCSELCGVGHGFMPIVVDVVSKEDFAAWVTEKKQEGGAAKATEPTVQDKAPAKSEKPAVKPPEKPTDKKSSKMDKAAARNSKLSSSAGNADETAEEEAEENEHTKSEDDNASDQE